MSEASDLLELIQATEGNQDQARILLEHLSKQRAPEGSMGKAAIGGVGESLVNNASSLVDFLASHGPGSTRIPGREADVKGMLPTGREALASVDTLTGGSFDESLEKRDQMATDFPASTGLGAALGDAVSVFSGRAPAKSVVGPSAGAASGRLAAGAEAVVAAAPGLRPFQRWMTSKPAKDCRAKPGGRSGRCDAGRAAGQRPDRDGGLECRHAARWVTCDRIG